MMRNYELTIVLPGSFTPAKVKSAKEKIEKIVKEQEGKLIKVDELGKLDLAYIIKKESAGIFLQYSLELKGKQAKDLDTKLNLEEAILRYLLLRKENGKEN